MHFAILPPEVNSGRMYAGPGVGPMLTAASAWDELANDLHSAADDFEGVVSGLTSDPWQGPAAESMMASAAPQTEWLRSTAAQATHASSQAKAAASAYESAFSMSVPPSEVAANRAQLMTLQATNLLGQNTAAIAANELAYGEMWAQDVAAMYGYAGAAKSASQVTPFTQPQQATNQGGLASQGNAVTQAAVGQAAGNAQATMSAVPSALQSLESSTGLTGFDEFSNAYNLASLGSSLLGNGTGWSSAAPQVRLAALEGPMANAAPASASGMLGDMPLLGQAPLMAMPGRDSGRGAQAADRRAPARPRAAVVATSEASSEGRATGAASQMREITDVLSKLADLRDNGALTD